MDEVPAPVADAAPSVLQDHSVRALLAVQGLATTASLCQATALGKAVYDATGRELDLGLLGLAEFLPAALLVVVSGNVADRRDRRRIAAVALSLEVACFVALALHVRSAPTSVWPFLLLAFAFGTARAFAAPATRALPPDVVGPERLPRLIALNALAWQAALVVGPVAAGFLYAGSPSWPFLLSAALASGAAVLVLRVRTPFARERPPAVRGGVREALAGLVIIRRTPILLGAVSLDLFAVLFGGAVALLPAIADERLGVGAVGLGWLRAAIGIGAAATTTWLATRPLRHHVGRILLVAVGVFGVGTVVLGLTRSFVVAFVALAVLSGADAVSVFVRATLVPLVTPDEARGRVLAVENVFIGASNELGAFESGVTGQLLGAGGAVVLGGVACVAVAGLWWVAFPALRRVDRFTDVRP